MKLLCLGDIAFPNADPAGLSWLPPAGIQPDADNQILFNWEFPTGTQMNPIPRRYGMRFYTHPNTVNIIRAWAPGMAALATNHILDACEEGLTTTLAALANAGFRTLGAGREADAIARPLLWQTQEGTLAIFNWVFPETDPEPETLPGPNYWCGIETARKQIAAAKTSADWVLAFLHWSDELFPYPLPQDRSLAAELAAAGADIIISHHPHVVRGMEIINGCAVYYSLGNFHFADIPDGNGGWLTQGAPRNKEALGVMLTFQRGKPILHQPLSFWRTDTGYQPDKRRRAERRLRTTSRPLHRFQGAAYLGWYTRKRKLFDTWGSRWHFGVRRLGFTGSIRRIIQLLRSPGQSSEIHP